MTATEPSVQAHAAPAPKKKGRPKGSKNPPKLSFTHEAPAKDYPAQAESPDQKRARLLAELADLSPASGGIAIGPNYWSMSMNALKTACIGRGIVDRSGTKEGMVAALQAEDAKTGLSPHAKENENAMSGLRAGNTLIHAEPQNRDSIRIIDADGNQYAMVYRVGRNIAGNPVILDMDGNAKKIVAALNEGRG